MKNMISNISIVVVPGITWIGYLNLVSNEKTNLAFSCFAF